jgi:hypothetical protein
MLKTNVNASVYSVSRCGTREHQLPKHCLNQPHETQFLHRADLLDKGKSTGRTSKRKEFLTVAMFWNEELNYTKVIVSKVYIPFLKRWITILRFAFII